jgi:probable phosphoglycerate mutase
MSENTAPSTKPTRLYLVRHGQAVVNVKPIIGGMKGDVGLTDLGRRQAERLRDRLVATREIRADALVASTLPRARETAEIIAPALGLQPIPDDEVQEFRVGEEGDGLSVDEYKKRYGWLDMEKFPTQRVDPGGESWVMFAERVSGALNRLAQEYEGRGVAVVCHGGIIDAAFVHFFGMDASSLPRVGFGTENTSLTLWEKVSHRGRMRWRLSYYNDHAHLHGMELVRNIDFTDIGDKPAAPAVPTEDATPIP